MQRNAGSPRRRLSPRTPTGPWLPLLVGGSVLARSQEPTRAENAGSHPQPSFQRYNLETCVDRDFQDPQGSTTNHAEEQEFHPDKFLLTQAPAGGKEANEGTSEEQEDLDPVLRGSLGAVHPCCRAPVLPCVCNYVISLLIHVLFALI